MIFYVACCFVLLATYSASQVLAFPRVVRGIANSQTFTDVTDAEGVRKVVVPEIRTNNEDFYHTINGYSDSIRRKRAVVQAVHFVGYGKHSVLNPLMYILYLHEYSSQEQLSLSLFCAIQIGFKVVEGFLTNARQVPSSNELRRKYIKPGGKKQWQRDFQAIIYDDVKDYKTKDGINGQVGKIGDRVVISKNKGPDGKPTIEILRTKDKFEYKKTGRKFDRTRDEITYID